MRYDNESGLAGQVGQGEVKGNPWRPVSEKLKWRYDKGVRTWFEDDTDFFIRKEDGRFSLYLFPRGRLWRFDELKNAKLCAELMTHV